MNIGQWLQRAAHATPDAPAIYLGQDLQSDYAGFHDSAARLASWLQGQGIASGDRVGLFMKNGPDYLIGVYAVWYAGAVVVPVNAKLHGREAAWILANAGAKLTLASPELAEALTDTGSEGRIVDQSGEEYQEAFRSNPIARPVQRDPEDLAWLFYTSGTTGRPKGVMITHRMLISMSLCYLADVDTVRAQDATLYAAPMSHGAGLYMPVHVLKGARHICPVSSGFDAAEALDLARYHRDLHLFAAPTMVKRLTTLAKQKELSGDGLRTVVYAGGPMYLADILEATAQFGPIFVQIYGQGECPMGITALSRKDVAERNHARWRTRLASVGTAQSMIELRIGDENGRALPCGNTGEIMVRGDTVMPGYWHDTDATSKTLVDGWLRTGDLGHLDQDGYLTLQDRSKDMIISGGSNIYPREVEEALLLHPSVMEVAVVGRKNDEWGEDVVAFVVTAGNAPLDGPELDSHCLAQIARFKRPKAYIEITELPKNNYGKVLKTDLRKRLERGATDQPTGSDEAH